MCLRVGIIGLHWLDLVRAALKWAKHVKRYKKNVNSLQTEFHFYNIKKKYYVKVFDYVTEN